ncbi:hypothetical protein, partial [Bacillus sp. WP8]|uniref:hypothetical protein n=1 Tax=Bacillus sp. WP8 TaxID=756828 RepID=UPI0011A59094
MKPKIPITLTLFSTILAAAFFIDRNHQKTSHAGSQSPLFSHHLLHMTYQETNLYPLQPRE